MAMTKKEQAAMQAAIDRAELLAALRWTSPVAPDVAPPGSGGCYTEGWMLNAYSKRVERGWSGVVTHGFGKHGALNSGSQGARRLYSTEAKALAALRYELEQMAAADLLAIDRRIRVLTDAA